MSAMSDFRDRLRRVDVPSRTADAVQSAQDAADAARDAAVKARKAAKKAAHKAGSTSSESAAELAERIRPLIANARKATGPKVEAAKERITPMVGTAVDRVTPAALSARDTFLEDVVPKVAAALAAGADKFAERATDVGERSLAIVEKPRKRRRRRRMLLIVTSFTVAGAVAAAVLRRRGEAQQWTTYDPSAAPWAPTPPDSDDGTADRRIQRDRRCRSGCGWGLTRRSSRRRRGGRGEDQWPGQPGRADPARRLRSHVEPVQRCHQVRGQEGDRAGQARCAEEELAHQEVGIVPAEGRQRRLTRPAPDARRAPAPGHPLITFTTRVGGSPGPCAW